MYRNKNEPKNQKKFIYITFIWLYCSSRQIVAGLWTMSPTGRPSSTSCTRRHQWRQRTTQSSTKTTTMYSLKMPVCSNLPVFWATVMMRTENWYVSFGVSESKNIFCIFLPFYGIFFNSAHTCTFHPRPLSVFLFCSSIIRTRQRMVGRTSKFWLLAKSSLRRGLGSSVMAMRWALRRVPSRWASVWSITDYWSSPWLKFLVILKGIYLIYKNWVWNLQKFRELFLNIYNLIYSMNYCSRYITAGIHIYNIQLIDENEYF